MYFMIDRRLFIQSIAIAAAGSFTSIRAGASSGFGPVLKDPNNILDLPEGFSYRVISSHGDEMDDGLLVPGRADGMAAFSGAHGNVNIVCNHENRPSYADFGPFGEENERIDRIDTSKMYDLGHGKTPATGGTTTIVFDPRSGATVHRHLSLAGTELNCAGGPTPWGSWLSCEESFSDPGVAFEFGAVVRREKRHGYVFEVPAAATAAVMPVPLCDMGRFKHEAAAVNPASGVVYLTEDRHRSLFYRYIPNIPGKLSRGGRLQAMAIADKPSFDTRNWDNPATTKLRTWMETRWVDLTDVDTEADDLRLRGFEAGAARFARGEGLCYAQGSIFMTATYGGPNISGQVFEYRLSTADGTDAESRNTGAVRLVAESTPQSVLHHADNLTMSPWGDLIVCEDTASHCGLIGIRPNGEQYELADNAYSPSELAGICFSPDGSVMFVNIQHRGLTLAITGPWR